MNLVKPIKCKNQLQEIKQALSIGVHGKRDLFMFELGINTGMRISDILCLRVRDVRGVTHIKVKEKKTRKSNEFAVNAYLSDVINNYTNGMDSDELLFKSRKGDKAITRVQAHHILKKASEYCGLKIEIGCHSLRKSFGYHFYHSVNGDIVKLMKIFNHSSQEVTLRYIGIEREDIDDSLKDFAL